LNKAIDLKNGIKSILKKFEDLKIPLNIDNQKKDNKTGDDYSKAGTSKSFESNSIKDSLDELDEKKRKRQELLKIAPIINLDEIHFMTPITSKVEAENGIYHKKDENIKQVSIY
jgi:hypothetical protein